MTKLGSTKRPLILRVQDESKIGDILEICNKNNWRCIIGCEPDKPEDLSDLKKLLQPPEKKQPRLKIGRNELCPCGSQKKFKKCCQVV
jgi:SWIM/SEC-C metal-binding protein